MRRFADRSVTELEMLYGALLPALAPPSASSLSPTRPSPLFFIRREAEEQQLPHADAVRLADLHNRVRTGFPFSEYSNASHLGEVRLPLLFIPLVDVPLC